MASDIFEKMKSSVNKGITTISVKTSSSLEKSKIKTHIESITKDIERDYSAIGEAAYRVWTSGSMDFSVLVNRFEAVKQKQEEIVALNQQFDAIDERDSQILGTAAAAAAIPVEEAPKAICPNCGAQYAEPVRFCRQCGTQIQA